MKILLCRCPAQKIGTDSGKKLQKNNIKPKKIQPKITTSTTVIPKTRSKTQKPQPKTPSPYDPQNPYKEPQSGPKDITGKDIEKDLIENDPLKGSQTDRNTQRSDEAQSASFETIAPEKDNPVNRNSKLDSLAMRSFRKMKLPEMSPVRVQQAMLNLLSEILMIEILHQ
ncbi:hypothetical protein ACHRVW_12115 [Flavobacterium collinsii]|uniref:hypothetical protein n=1 Tax=Flavobacterium collinsii TaxID=1114861 RepID=UPI003756F431